MTYLGVAVNLQDRDNYSEIEFYDLCQLLVIHAEQAEQLSAELKEEVAQLQAGWAELNLTDQFIQFQIYVEALEFEYVIALRWLQLAQRQKEDFRKNGFCQAQTRINADERVKENYITAAAIRDNAIHAGVSVDDVQSLYA